MKYAGSRVSGLEGLCILFGFPQLGKYYWIRISLAGNVEPVILASIFFRRPEIKLNLIRMEITCSIGVVFKHLC